MRDVRTRAHLGMAGIASALLPDPAVGVAALCGARVSEAAAAPAASALRQALPQGYLAVQLAELERYKARYGPLSAPEEEDEDEDEEEGDFESRSQSEISVASV